MKRRIVVTGGSGYIGSILVPILVEEGFQVRVIDRFFFGDTLPNSEHIEKIRLDSRSISLEHLSQAYAVIDMAAISNDPAGELDPVKTFDINYRSRRRLQELASEAGVERYILASSCSVYGFQEGILSESSPVKPLTTYALANIKAEESALELLERGSGMAITIFRQATMYGLSPRMRFDLAVNGMTLGMWKSGKIPLLRDGKQWRPMIHIRDTSKAFISALKADIEQINGQIFNVGANDQNFQMLQVAHLVAQGLNKQTEFDFYGEPDHRSYQVNFDKIKKYFDFTPDWSVEKGAYEIADALERKLTDSSAITKTVSWYSLLLDWEKRIKEIAPDGYIL